MLYKSSLNTIRDSFLNFYRNSFFKFSHSSLQNFFQTSLIHLEICRSSSGLLHEFNTRFWIEDSLDSLPELLPNIFRSFSQEICGSFWRGLCRNAPRIFFFSGNPYQIYTKFLQRFSLVVFGTAFQQFSLIFCEILAKLLSENFPGFVLEYLPGFLLQVFRVSPGISLIFLLVINATKISKMSQFFSGLLPKFVLLFFK